MKRVYPYQAFVAVLLSLMFLSCLALGLAAFVNRKASAVTVSQWYTVRQALDDYITSQYEPYADGESGFLETASDLKGRIDSNNDDVILGEGDDAANAPVLVDVLYSNSTMIPATAVRCNWNASCLSQLTVNQVAGTVDAHEQAGFSTDIVVYCLSGHTESVVTGGYGAVAHAGGLGGSVVPRVLALKWGRYGWNTGTWNYARNNPLGPPKAPESYPLASNIYCGQTPGPDSEAVRCLAEWALSPTGGNVGAGLTPPPPPGSPDYEPVDLRSGPVTLTMGDEWTTHIPLQTVFNTGMQHINPSGGKSLFANRTQHTAGIVAVGAEMLGYDSVFLKWGLPNWNATLDEKFTSGEGYPLVPSTAIDVNPPAYVSGPSVSYATPESADISRTTDEPATMKVEYGTSPGVYTETINDTVLNSSKTVSLTGLSPSTTYYVRVTSFDGMANAAVSDEMTYYHPVIDSPCRPDLAVSHAAPASWLSYDDYLARRLTVPMRIASSRCSADDVRITGATNTNGVTLLETPYNLGIIADGGFADAQLRYHVPSGVSYFRSDLTGTAADELTGEIYFYP